jgi:hypothetical protein
MNRSKQFAPLFAVVIAALVLAHPSALASSDDDFALSNTSTSAVAPNQTELIAVGYLKVDDAQAAQDLGVDDAEAQAAFEAALVEDRALASEQAILKARVLLHDLPSSGRQQKERSPSEMKDLRDRIAEIREARIDIRMDFPDVERLQPIDGPRGPPQASASTVEMSDRKLAQVFKAIGLLFSIALGVVYRRKREALAQAELSSMHEETLDRTEEAAPEARIEVERSGPGGDSAVEPRL